MNQKALKKQLTTISSKDETWQGFLGANVPNRVDDPSKLEKVEEKKEEPALKKKDKKDKEEKAGGNDTNEKAKGSKNDSHLKPGDR